MRGHLEHTLRCLARVRGCLKISVIASQMPQNGSIYRFFFVTEDLALSCVQMRLNKFYTVQQIQSRVTSVPVRAARQSSSQKPRSS